MILTISLTYYIEIVCVLYEFEAKSDFCGRYILTLWTSTSIKKVFNMSLTK